MGSHRVDTTEVTQQQQQQQQQESKSLFFGVQRHKGCLEYSIRGFPARLKRVLLDVSFLIDEISKLQVVTLKVFVPHGFHLKRLIYQNMVILIAAISATAAAKSLQSCPTLCNPMDCSLPGSSSHGIFQARVLEWVAIAFSNRSHQAFALLELLSFSQLWIKRSRSQVHWIYCDYL